MPHTAVTERPCLLLPQSTGSGLETHSLAAEGGHMSHKNNLATRKRLHEFTLKRE